MSEALDPHKEQTFWFWGCMSDIQRRLPPTHRNRKMCLTAFAPKGWFLAKFHLEQWSNDNHSITINKLCAINIYSMLGRPGWEDMLSHLHHLVFSTYIHLLAPSCVPGQNAERSATFLSMSPGSRTSGPDFANRRCLGAQGGRCSFLHGVFHSHACFSESSAIEPFVHVLNRIWKHFGKTTLHEFAL